MGVISRNWPFFRKRLHLIQAAIKFSSKQKAFQEHLASYKSSTTSTQEKKDKGECLRACYLHSVLYVAACQELSLIVTVSWDTKMQVPLIKEQPLASSSENKMHAKSPFQETVALGAWQRESVKIMPAL